MRISSLRRSLLAAGIVFALIPVLLSAEQPETARSKPPASPVEKGRRDLEQTVTLTDAFKPGGNYELQEVLDVLHKQLKLKFEIDNRGFFEAGLKDVQSVSITVPEWKDVKVKEVLRYMLKRVPLAPYEAAYVLVGDTIVITSELQVPYFWMRQPVNLVCEKEELSSVLKRLAHETGTNLVLDARAAKEGQTLITLEIYDAPLEMVVYLLADMVDLQPVRAGNVLYVTTKDNACQMRADPDRAKVIGPCPLPPQYQAMPAEN